MFDERTNRRKPKQETLKKWPNATCRQAGETGYVVLSNESGQQKIIGEGRSSWQAWMWAEIAERAEDNVDLPQDKSIQQEGK